MKWFTVNVCVILASPQMNMAAIMLEDELRNVDRWEWIIITEPTSMACHGLYCLLFLRAHEDSNKNV